jgi:bifunctional ADP-heptose synthase (sugar kinase/adenylyltransferase)
LKRAAIIAVAFGLLLPVTAWSQTRKRAARAPQPTAAQKSAEVVHGGATRVADQIKNLTRFIYLLGGVAKGIEEGDAAIRRNDASPAVVDQIKRSKATVKTSLADVRAGLDKLELDFRSTPELNRYYTSLVGSAAGAADAEDQAAAGRFDQAGRTLLGVVNRLTDVLLEMK